MSFSEATVDVVEDADQRRDAARRHAGGAARLEQRGELLLEDGGDVLDDLRIDPAHGGDAVGHVDAQLLLHLSEDLGRMVRGHVDEDDRDGLGVLLGQEGVHLERVETVQQHEGPVGADVDLLHDLVGPVGAQALLEQSPRRLSSTLLNGNHAVDTFEELADHVGDHGGVELGQLRHLGHEHDDFGLAHGLERHCAGGACPSGPARWRPSAVRSAWA